MVQETLRQFDALRLRFADSLRPQVLRSAEDMESLKSMEQIEDYGDVSMFPVYGGVLA